VQSYARKGLIYNELGDIKKSIKSFKKALILNPEWLEVHNNLGILFLNNENFEEAIYHFEKCVALKPDSIVIFNRIRF
jgi:tetratricopeptide (TPR) repeat protein